MGTTKLEPVAETRSMRPRLWTKENSWALGFVILTWIGWIAVTFGFASLDEFHLKAIACFALFLLSLIYLTLVRILEILIRLEHE